MKAELECIPCILRQTVSNVQYLTNDRELQKNILNKVLKFLQHTTIDLSPPELGKLIFELIMPTSSNEDPFKEIKKKDNRFLLSKYQYLKSMIYKSANPIRTAANLAIGGNVIDYGANQHPII